MNNPFDYIPDTLCEEAYRRLIIRLEILKKSENPDDKKFCAELESGKMLGVLIAEDSDARKHTLYAFSGQLGDSGFYFPGFVEPVFDYLNPNGYFKNVEKEISQQNYDIKRFEDDVYLPAKEDYERLDNEMQTLIADYKEKCRVSKSLRNEKRKRGTDAEQMAAMIRESQFEKAELNRLKKRAKAILEPGFKSLQNAKNVLDDMKRKRSADSENLQQWLFSNFRVLNAHGESKSLSEIFAETSPGIPPSGSGECCAPKLLQAAYRRGWKPIAMAEYWYGKPKNGELRINGSWYPACRGKCLPILRWMLKGLNVTPTLDNTCCRNVESQPEIIYENEWFCVVNKPSGMLSVNGKSSQKSVEKWLTEKYGDKKVVKMAHRLDMDTSGLIIATFGELSYKTMQKLFALRKVDKCYIAELAGDYRQRGLEYKGTIRLPISPDLLDRPRQRVDFQNGKTAVTDYEFVGVKNGCSRVEFHPITGRTHQLRIHAASELGLGMSIKGDPLYGEKTLNSPANTNQNSNRLMLHAQKIEFTFPLDNNHYCFEIPAPF